MSPEISTAVDPIITYVLSVMNEIEENVSPPIAEDVHARCVALIDRAETMLSNSQQWNLAKYAIVAWVDDLLIDSPWEGRVWWHENHLELRYFQSTDAFTEFYQRSKQATILPNKDALEVFYVCVVLGFRGVYGDPNGIAKIEENDLPLSIEEWARRTSMSIELGRDRPELIEQGRPGLGAPPREGKYLVIGSAILFVVLLLSTILTYYSVFSGTVE